MIFESVRALESEHMQGFIKRVLERRDRLEVFLKAPASKHYHHNGSGGLLVHSLEVAKGVLNMIRINEPDMPSPTSVHQFSGSEPLNPAKGRAGAHSPRRRG